MAQLHVNRIRCNVCGGDLEQEENKFWRCAHCHSRFEISEKVPEETVIALNAANTDRMLFRFDDAREKYDLILEKSPTLPEACWGALLAFYGIKYEKDYDGVTFIPTCHRLSETPVEKCPYYPFLTDQAKQRAVAIETLRQTVWTKSQTIAAYDVFLCYKKTDRYYERDVLTKEAIWAREAYEMLTRELGLRVFFAESSLEQLNEEWEPHIYRALSTAKLMLVFASSVDHVNSVWVKNEWKRFAAYIREGQNKTIRVVYDLFNPADLPRELSSAQAICHDGMHWGENVKKAAESVFLEREHEKTETEQLKELFEQQLEELRAQLAAAQTAKRAPTQTPNLSDVKQDITPKTDVTTENMSKSVSKPISEPLSEPEPKEETVTETEKENQTNEDALLPCLEKISHYLEEKNYTEAIKWIKKAAEYGYVEAQGFLGYCYDEGLGVEVNKVEAVKWYQKAAEQGIKESQYGLGEAYMLGEGIEQNIDEALKWLTRSAEQGHNQAQCVLGFYYGTVGDLENAEAWLQKAAEQGHEQAQLKLGLFYEQSKPDEALKWFKKAAEQGNAEAQFKLGGIYILGQSVEKNIDEALKWLIKSAEQDCDQAQCTLGLYYETVGDFENAEAWLQKAAAQGHKEAQQHLAILQDDVEKSFKIGLKFYGSGMKKNCKEDYEEAVKYFTKAAEQGHKTAQFFLGICYYGGLGTDANEENGIKWMTKSAEQGFAQAQWLLGNDCEKAGDLEEAEMWYQKAADQGHEEAQQHLEILKTDPQKWFEAGLKFYKNGSKNDSETDYEKAVKWFTKSAEQGNKNAQCYLGICIADGLGTERNRTNGINWITRAANQGHAGSQYLLGHIYEGEYKWDDSVKWYQKAAEQGYVKAQYKLADCYYVGRGIQENKAQAVRWYKKAAEQGHVEAQCELADCYRFGFGIEKNEEKAIKWYQKAAEQGYVEAQYKLADCYYWGFGIEENEEKAFEWFQKAAEQGYKDAERMLGICYRNGRGVAQDFEAALKWFEKATHHSSDEDDRNGSDVVDFESYLDSIKELGDAYLNGTGVEKNAEKANECYKQFFEKTKAYAEGGEGEVYKYRLGFCYMDGIGVEKNAAMAMQCWKDAPFHLYKVRAAYDKQANQWKAENVCRHCGGKFKGLFKKKCSNCGLEKDYKKPRKK